MQAFTTRPEILGTFGVVTSTHWLASAVGMAVLERGGNAFDAAVATGFTLQVVEPHLNGLGGEVPIIFSNKAGDVQVICGQGVSPELATLQTYQDLGLDIVPGSGLLAAVVPGAFDAWMLMLRDHGTLRLADVLQYAIYYAEKGCPLVPGVSNTISTVAELFRSEWTSSADIYLPNNQVPEPGSLFQNKPLAQTYKRLLAEATAASSERSEQIEAARNIWRQGFVAQSIDQYCRNTEVMDTTGERHKGLLRASDMAAWQASYEAPLCYDYQDYTVCKTQAWGQGPVFLQQLALLQGFDLSSLDPCSAEFVHLVTEASKLAFADREAFYADPKHVDVPMEQLLSKSYNDERRRLITDQASMELRPGKINGYHGRLVVRHKTEVDAAGRRFNIGEPTLADNPVDPDTRADGASRGDTCHLDVIDRWGNMVSATPSGGWLQSSPVIPDLGFCLSNRAQMFWLDEHSPACLRPSARPRTTLTPGLALRDGVPYMVFGTPGGDQQDQWALHFFLRHVHHGMNLQQAIDAPGFNTSHFPNSFYPREVDLGHLAIEGRFSASVQQALRNKGHLLQVTEDWMLGRMSAASRVGDLLRAAANPRQMQGYAIGR